MYLSNHNWIQGTWESLGRIQDQNALSLEWMPRNYMPLCFLNAVKNLYRWKYKEKTLNRRKREEERKKRKQEWKIDN